MYTVVQVPQDLLVLESPKSYSLQASRSLQVSLFVSIASLFLLHACVTLLIMEGLHVLLRSVNVFWFFIRGCGHTGGPGAPRLCPAV